MSRISKILLGLVLSISLNAQAAVNLGQQEAIQLSKTVLATKAAGIFNWNLGDTLNFQIVVKDFPVGNMSMVFDAKTKKENLLSQNFDFFGKKFTIQVGYDKETGALVSYRINGVKMPMPENQPTPDIKIVKQEEAKIEVPAGEFECIHTVIESEKGQQTEIWMNPQELPLTGMLKTLTKIKNIDVKMELTSFAGKN